MKTRLLVAIASLLALPLYGQEATGASATQSARIRHARAALEQAHASLATATNEADRTHWQSRVQLTELALSNYAKLADLENREKDLITRRKRSPEFALRTILGTIDMNLEALRETAKLQRTEIQRLRELRSMEEERRETQLGDPDTPLDHLARTEERLDNIDAQIFANLLRRDDAELRARLATEATRIDKAVDSLEKDLRVRLGMLLLRRRDIRLAEETGREVTALRKDVEQQVADTIAGLELAEQRLDRANQEIAILDARLQAAKDNEGAGRAEKGSVFRRILRLSTEEERELKQLIEDAQTDKSIVEENIGHLKLQLDALTDSHETAHTFEALLEAEITLRRDHFVVLQRRFIKRVLVPTIAVAVVLLGYFLLSRLVFPLVFKRDALFVSRRLGGYVVVLIVILILVAFFFEDLKAIATVMGIVGAAIVIALQDLCSAFAGWFIIIASRKLRVGDRVEIDGQRGEIIDIQLLRITLVELNNWLGVDEPTGRVLIIPNSFIFKSPVFNYSHVHPFIWGKVDITVTFETPVAKAHETLLHGLEEETRLAFTTAARGGKRMAQQYGVTRGIYEPHIHVFIAESGVTFSLFYVAHYREFTKMRDKIMNRVLKDFEANKDLHFAYPTERIVPTAAPGQFQIDIKGETKPGKPGREGSHAT